MGYYTEISNSSDAAKDVALQNRMRGVSYHSGFGLAVSQAAPQLLTLTIGKILSGTENNEESKNDKKADNSEDAQRQQLIKELKSALKEIGANGQNDIEGAVQRAQEAHDKRIGEYQAKVDAFSQGTDEYSVKIGSLQNQLGALTPENDPEGKQKVRLEKQIADLQKNQEKALKKAQEDLSKVTETEDAKLNKIGDKAKEAADILKQIAELNKVDDADDVNVEETTTALNSFTKAKDSFTSAKTPEDKKKYAAELKELYENNPEDKTIAAGYKLLKSQVEAALK